MAEDQGAQDTVDDDAAANDQFIADLRAVDPRLNDLDDDLVTEVAIGRAARDTKLRQAYAQRTTKGTEYRQQLRMTADAIKARAKELPGRGLKRRQLSEEDAAVLNMTSGQFIEHCRKKGIHLGL